MKSDREFVERLEQVSNEQYQTWKDNLGRLSQYKQGYQEGFADGFDWCLQFVEEQLLFHKDSEYSIKAEDIVNGLREQEYAEEC